MPRPWTDISLTIAERVESLLAEMTPDEKLAQLGSAWVGANTAFTGLDIQRVVEPGEIHVMVGASSEDIRGRGAFRLTGETRVVGHDRVLTTPARCSPA